MLSRIILKLIHLNQLLSRISPIHLKIQGSPRVAALQAVNQLAGPPRANNANPPTPVELQKFPGTTKSSPSTPSLPSSISSQIHLGRDLSQCRYHSPGHPSRVSSKLGTRGTSKAAPGSHPTAPETTNSHLLICPPHTVKQRKRETHPHPCWCRR